MRPCPIELPLCKYSVDDGSNIALYSTVYRSTFPKCAGLGKKELAFPIELSQ